MPRDVGKALGLPEDVTGTYDRILLCVKAHHTEAATKALARVLAADGYVLSCQNGLNEMEIGRIVGRAGDRAGHKRIVRAALEMFTRDTPPGKVVDVGMLGR